jgi:acyl-CoA synthetase (AMP-forming)/AMP-acid ligase II
VDLSCWRAALDGAEPIAGHSLRRFVERFAPHGFAERALMPVYGLSEAALAVTFTPLGSGWRSTRVDPRRLAADGAVVAGRREVVSVGRPVPGVEVEIRDEEARVVPCEHLGRIFVRSRSVMTGYLGDPEGTARALSGGWLETGDLGFVRAGELYVHGRAKDVLVVHGANHAPDEIESALRDVPGLRPGCAVAVADVRDDGREVLIVLTERAGPSSADAEVVSSARQAIVAATGIVPDELILLAAGTLPRTSSGKMRRSEALRRWTAGTLRPPRRSAGVALAITLARSILARRRSGSRASTMGT